MIRAARVRSVARFELLSAVRRPSYFIMTFGLPVFFTVLTGVPALLQGRLLAEEVRRVDRWALVDDAGVLALDSAEPLRLDQVVFLPYAAEGSARAAVAAGEIDGYFVIPESYLERGEVRLYSRPRASPVHVGRTAAEQTLRNLLVQRLLSGRVPDRIAERVRRPLTFHRLDVERDGSVRQKSALAGLGRFVTPLVIALLLMMALMTTSGYLVHAVSVEKENRVIEVLLASVHPDELMAGKLLGLGAAGLFQFMVWSLMAVAASLSVAGMLPSVSLDVPWDVLGVALLFFVFGYLFLGSLMLATGSVGTTAAEGQKLTVAWALLAAMPVMLLAVITHSPQGLLARVLSWVPFTSPLTVPLRMAADPQGVPWWEVASSLGVLLLATWFGVQLGARLFRVALLFTGSRPSLREVVRQARLLG